MGGYPLHLDLQDRRVLVVGGGPVGARRAAGALAAGADVLVVAPRLCADLARLVADGAVRWREGSFTPADLDGAWLVHTATGVPDVDAAVADAAREQRLWCVRADDASASDAAVPAVARSGDVTVGVSASGDPHRAAAVRNRLAAVLDAGDAPLRRRRPGPGSVALVGGGPGADDLLTVRGQALLARADVVVVDRLAPRGMLGRLDEDVLVVDVGKSPDHHPVPQEEINRLLVEHARAGRRVVRLKGGDPYVLGRGSEEAAACRAAGVPVEVVPGVTSAIAVPAAAGIPVTARGVSRQVTVLSAHDDADWPSLASVDGTLVLLMGVARLERACAHLVAHGKDPRTPVAIVERGFLPDQRTTTGTLADIAGTARHRGVTNPAVVVIGDVVALADDAGEIAPPGAAASGTAPAPGPPVVPSGESADVARPGVVRLPDPAATAPARRAVRRRGRRGRTPLAAAAGEARL